jgi:hypothetical protein
MPPAGHERKTPLFVIDFQFIRRLTLAPSQRRSTVERVLATGEV